MEEGQEFELNIQVKGTDESHARALLSGMQGLVNDLGVEKCLGILDKIRNHPNEFKKALSMMDNPVVLGLIKSF